MALNLLCCCLKICGIFSDIADKRIKCQEKSGRDASAPLDGRQGAGSIFFEKEKSRVMSVTMNL
jgi:hypothetical protein